MVKYIHFLHMVSHNKRKTVHICVKNAPLEVSGAILYVRHGSISRVLS